MEYALEGYGFSAARMLRNLLPQRRSEGGPARDPMADFFVEMLDSDYQRYGESIVEIMLQGLSGDLQHAVRHPPELLSTLRAQGLQGPVKGLARSVASAAKAAFDELRQSLELRLTVCSLDSGPHGGELMRLGVYLPGLAAEVRAHDEVTAGVMVALHGQPGGGGLQLEVVPRMYRKLCENGLIVSVGEVFTHKLDLQHLMASQDEAPLVRALSEAIHSCFDKVVFDLAVRAFQRSAHESLEDTRHAESLVGRLSPEVREAVLRRYHRAGDLTRWGLVNAVTAEARGATSDQALRLERLGTGLAFRSVARSEHVPDSSSRPSAKKLFAA